MMAWRQSVYNLVRPLCVRNLSGAIEVRGSQSPCPAFTVTSGIPLAAAPPPVLCGRGDKKTKKGKRFKGSFGNSRPKKDKKIARIKEKVEVPTSTPWPLPFKLI
ncbi:hypothetical protein SUGI_0181260 [Cryptomeria japonica]|uniref:small ribosomal subunit protein bTHXm n=1 Tax=Cryptomeria japonica TaxID=3369 RepID=UPI002408D17F|nr:small ribosomal subunit protein bTHXm [Cryptomeria japonica]GLJ11972.1 hypothetical protein SUGI_0181260 [Cryptomeria japonica]